MIELKENKNATINGFDELAKIIADYDMVIFDIDGTLSKKELVKQLYKLAFKKHNIRIEPTEWNIGKEKLNAKWIETKLNITRKESEEIYKSYKNMFDECENDIFRNHLFPDVLPFFKFLKERNIQIGIFTLREKGLAKMQIKKCGLEPYISTYFQEGDIKFHISGSSKSKKKTKRSPIESKIAQLKFHLKRKPNIKRNKILVVGDSYETDISSAEFLNLDNILIQRL